MEGSDRDTSTYDLLACVNARRGWFVRLLGADPSVRVRSATRNNAASQVQTCWSFLRTHIFTSKRCESYLAGFIAYLCRSGGCIRLEVGQLQQEGYR